MLVADFLYVNHALQFDNLLMFMLTKDKYLTPRLTFGHFLHHTYASRQETGFTNKNEKVKTKK